VAVYESMNSYEVTAGVGQFNGSYVPDYLKKYKDINQDYGPAVLPYSNVITASNLVVNPMHSTAIDPVACEDNRECHSYLFSGGLIMTTPWPPTDYPSYPVITIARVPTIQINFVRGIHNDSFYDGEDCTVFGEDGILIGIKFCLARSRSAKGSLFAGTLKILLRSADSGTFRSLCVYTRCTGEGVLDRHQASRSNDNVFNISPSRNNHYFKIKLFYPLN
jgi:hypothetical protein